MAADNGTVYAQGQAPLQTNTGGADTRFTNPYNGLQDAADTQKKIAELQAQSAALKSSDPTGAAGGYNQALQIDAEIARLTAQNGSSGVTNQRREVAMYNREADLIGKASDFGNRLASYANGTAVSPAAALQNQLTLNQQIAAAKANRGANAALAGRNAAQAAAGANAQANAMNVANAENQVGNFLQGQQGLTANTINGQKQDNFNNLSLNVDAATKRHGQDLAEADNQSKRDAGIAGSFGSILGILSKAKGGVVAASFHQQKAMRPGDSLANDKIPAMLSEGEVVIPRSIMQSKNPGKEAKNFIEALIHQNGGPKQENMAYGGMAHAAPQGYGAVLAAQNALRQRMPVGGK